MAYSALVTLSQTIDLILDPLKYSISVAEKEQITDVREHTNYLISLLESSPNKSNRLEGKLRDVAAKAEINIDNFMWNQIHGSSRDGGRRTRAKCRRNLRVAREELGSIVADMMDDRLGDAPATSAAISSSSSSSRLPSTGKNDIVVGLDEESFAIKIRLCGESSKLEVIPILGMGGIGKSTLARCAFDDQLTVEHFFIRAWVTISQDYSPVDILSCLQDSMKMFGDQILEHENEFTMREKVYKCLKGRRYLIVMDDVWSTKALDEVRNIFPDDDNGSRIILTTRLSDVATYAVSDSLVHELKFLNDDQCWSLLEKKVFANGQGCPSELEDVGKEIARSCRGLPLAVVLIAGVLSKMVETRASWEKILKKLNSIVGEKSEEILSLSYTHLPYNLRACFLYLGGFPEDHKIRVSKLIKLWVAEGFLKRTNESKSLEEEAEEYLEDLVERSLVLVSSRKSNGKIKSCSLHDLVRDLSIRKAQEEKFLVRATNKVRDVRRLSIRNSNTPCEIRGSTILTILCFLQFRESRLSLIDLLEGVKLLRVLDVANDSHEHLPLKIFCLFHLRYFALRIPSDIPLTIYKLENLHTLIINQKTNPSRRRLPFHIWRTPQLRHLVVYFLYAFLDNPDGSILPMENLQTLLEVNGPVCNEKFLKMFPNVKKLGLIYDRNCSHGEYELYNLTHLDKLEKLKITMKDFFFRLGRNPAFPRTLKKLTLYGGGLSWKDMTIVGALPNLEVLKLIYQACDGDTWETADGEFSQLKFLLIELSTLRHWITERSHFPRLKCLILRRCHFLIEVPDCIGEIPSLELIELDNQNTDLVESAKAIINDQQSYGNDALQLRIVDRVQECYMIGARELVIKGSDELNYWQWNPSADSRFSVVAYLKNALLLDISVKIRTYNLLSNTLYASYLVYTSAEESGGLQSANAVIRFWRDKAGYDVEETSEVVYLQKGEDDDDGGPREQNQRRPVWRDDGWMEVEIGSFYNHDNGVAEARLKGIDDRQWKFGLIVEGIEFRPNAQFDPPKNWANRFLPQPAAASGLERSTDSPMCYAIGARELMIEWGENPLHWKWKARADSRFPEVVELNWICQLEMSLEIKAHDLFSYSTYAVYLVFKLAERCYGLNSVYASVSYGGGHETTTVVHLQQLEQNGRHPVRRADGWMEVEMGTFYYQHEQANTVTVAKLTGIDGKTWKKGLIIECIEFRPKP